MRGFGTKGKCSKCGALGPIWRSDAKPLAIGGAIPPMEPAMQPDLCDDCECGRPPSNDPPRTPEDERTIGKIMGLLFPPRRK